jgi:GNAT superfamily N-acetyltransferase
MAAYHLAMLDRDDYIHSTNTIQDIKTRGFARLSQTWWDRHFSWKSHGCVVLCNAKDEHLSYIFYKIDRYHDYLTIHNLFTPRAYRRHGYAKELLKQVFTQANGLHVKRFRMSCVPQSLDFYLSLGMVYWGLTETLDYYCDLPLPHEGLGGLDAMICDSSIKELISTRGNDIEKKIKHHEHDLTQEQHRSYEEDKLKMESHYLLDTFYKQHSKAS